MSKEDLKRRVCEAIRARRADIKAVAESVFAEPELGFKETKTSDKIKAEFEETADEEGSARAVCDYISGMTDRYAINLYKELFVPKVWSKL